MVLFQMSKSQSDAKTEALTWYIVQCRKNLKKKTKGRQIGKFQAMRTGLHRDKRQI